MIYRTVMMIAALTLANTATAMEGQGPWKSDVELGFVQTGGNTKTQTINAKTKIVREVEAFRTTIEGTSLGTTDRGVTIAERHSASIQQDWTTSEYDYLFARIGFDTDRFGGFRQRLRETVGYGRDLIKRDLLHWNAEIGAGARQTTLTDNSKSNEIIGRASTHVEWKINEGTILTQSLSTEGGKEGFFTDSVTALQQKINSSLSSKITFSAQNTSKVPVGRSKTNTETAVTLVWSH